MYAKKDAPSAAHLYDPTPCGVVAHVYPDHYKAAGRHGFLSGRHVERDHGHYRHLQEPTDRFVARYYMSMSLEKRKKRRLPLLPEALAAGIALAAHTQMDTKEAKAEDPIGNFIQQDVGKFSEHAPHGDVEDRRMETKEHAHRLDFSELEPDGPINDELATSGLAEAAGANHIGKSPLEIMRARKAEADANGKRLAQEVHERWKREQAKKKR